MQHEVDADRNTTVRHGFFCRCGLQCSTNESLLTHIKSFNSPRNYHCKICNEKFVASNFLWAHMEVKHKVKLIKRQIDHGRIACGDCGEYFLSRQDHRRHREAYHEKITLRQYDKKNDHNVAVEGGTYDNEHGILSYEPPKCKCGTIYTNTRALAIHMRSKMKLFKCHLCSKRFGHLSSLTFHMESVHQVVAQQREQAFECGRCIHLFLTLEEIIEHCKECHTPASNRKHVIHPKIATVIKNASLNDKRKASIN